MKRRIFVCFILIALLHAMTLPVLAKAKEDATQPKYMTVDEDLQRLTIDSVVYVRANTTELVCSFETYETVYTIPNAEQYSSIIVYYMRVSEAVVEVEYTHKDGTILTMGYIKADLVDALAEVLTQEQYTIDFYYPEGNTVGASKDALWGETLTIPASKYISLTRFDAMAIHSSGLKVIKGELVEMDGVLYYADRAENEVEGRVRFVDRNTLVTVHKVEDEALLTRLNTALERYYDDDYGWLEDPDVSESMSDYTPAVIFIGIPATTLVLFGFFAIRSKKKAYRWINLMVCGWSVLTIVTAILLMVAF